MKAWITKYALTKGVLEVEAEDLTQEYTSMIAVEPSKNPHLGWAYRMYFQGDGQDWTSTLEEARCRFEELKIKKIQALRKQITELEKNEFKCKTNPI